jgi:hypothetical protein
MIKKMNLLIKWKKILKTLSSKLRIKFKILLNLTLDQNKYKKQII